MNAYLNNDIMFNKSYNVQLIYLSCNMSAYFLLKMCNITTIHLKLRTIVYHNVRPYCVCVIFALSKLSCFML